MTEELDHDTALALNDIMSEAETNDIVSLNLADLWSTSSSSAGPEQSRSALLNHSKGMDQVRVKNDPKAIAKVEKAVENIFCGCVTANISLTKASKKAQDSDKLGPAILEKLALAEEELPKIQEHWAQAQSNIDWKFADLKEIKQRLNADTRRVNDIISTIKMVSSLG